MSVWVWIAKCAYVIIENRLILCIVVMSQMS
jgi:hypothetical protein